MHILEIKKISSFRIFLPGNEIHRVKQSSRMYDTISFVFLGRNLIVNCHLM